MKDALLANDSAAIQTAATAINAAHGYLNDQAGFYGAVQNQISAALDLAQKFQTQGQARLSSDQDTDIAAAALEITQDTTHINAALASAAKQITSTLFDYKQISFLVRKVLLSRFHYVEQALEKSGDTLENATLAEMEALWQEAKTAK